MSYRNTLLMIILFIVSQQLFAFTYRIPADCRTIQDGINMAINGDTVLVSPGRYIENIDFQGKGITVGSLMLITDDEAYIDSTIIDGDSVDCVVAFNNAEPREAVLRGFTITRGIQDFGGGIDIQTNAAPQLLDLKVIGNYARQIGAGIYCTWDSQPLVRNVEITENHSDMDGGGFGSAHEALPLLQNVNITGNYAGRNGGGVFLGHGAGDAIMENCVINRNRAEGDGGGIAIYESDNTRLTNVTILFNGSELSGGVFVDYADPYFEYCFIGLNNNRGVTCWYDSRPTLKNCILRKNSGDEGAGIYCYDDSEIILDRTVIYEHNGAYGSALFSFNANAYLVNCSIFNNSIPRETGDGVISARNSNIVVLNSILWNEESNQIYMETDSADFDLVIAYSDILEGEEGIASRGDFNFDWLEGNIDQFPNWCVDDRSSDPFLFPDSPCIDNGTALFFWNEDTLLNMQQDDYFSRAPDMGAYESEYVNSVWRSGNQPAKCSLLKCYPNPFNSSTRITFELTGNEILKIAVFDLNGRVVLETSEVFSRGINEYVPNLSRLPSGIYNLNLESAGYSGTIILNCIK